MATLAAVRDLAAAAAAASAAAKTAAERAGDVCDALQAAEEEIVAADEAAAAADMGQDDAQAAELESLRQELAAERAKNAGLKARLAGVEADLAERTKELVNCQADLADFQLAQQFAEEGEGALAKEEPEEAEQEEEYAPGWAAASSSAAPAQRGAQRPRSPPGGPLAKRHRGGGKRRGRGFEEPAEPVWTEAMKTGRHRQAAGYKVHVADLPSLWMDGNELTPWLRSLGVDPVEVSSMKLSPKFERWQVVLTFDRAQEAEHAVAVLGGHRLEGPSKHPTVAKHWRPLPK